MTRARRLGICVKQCRGQRHGMLSLSPGVHPLSKVASFREFQVMLLKNNFVACLDNDLIFLYRTFGTVLFHWRCCDLKITQ